MSAAVTIVGGGLAGCEAAYQIARRGVAVRLFEMRPERRTEAHETDALAELVCSNSFRDDSEFSAVGILKSEMRALDSLVMRVAAEMRVPAGSALAVDREGFSRRMTEELEALELVEIVRSEVSDIPSEGVSIIASGPLTSAALSDALAHFVGTRHLYFYDAISPIITAESVNMDIAYRAARYGKGGDDYVNCPLDADCYNLFVDELLAAEKMPLKSFERCTYFEGCMPIEEIARRGRDTLRFGPMKPVGLEDPRSGLMHHAVVQLRQDDNAGTLLSMVGFQTKMKYPEQRRVFRLIPALADVEFVRLGSLHRNTFINSPRTLTASLNVRGCPRTFIAGQLVGVEGYVESAATGLLCGINAARVCCDQPLVLPPATSALGALLAYVTEESRKDFQPMNANFGLFPPLAKRMRGRDKKIALGRRALADLGAWISEAGVGNS